MLVADLAILTLCLRLMGVDAETLPLVDLVAAYVFAFPLTMFPAQGLVTVVLWRREGRPVPAR